MYVFLYLFAIVTANLTVFYFGESAVIINAFVFIGFDLTARDKLHEEWSNNSLLPKMAALILAGSALSYAMNSGALHIAIASFSAFAAAATVDGIVYHALKDKSKLLKINGSNVVSAAIDSLVFPTIAFGGLLWPLVIGQFLAKMLGGFVWSLVINKVS